MKFKNFLENQSTKKKRRALSVCFFSHSAGLGGAERSLLELVTELIKDYGVICTVVLPKDGPLKDRLEQAGASTHIIDYSWWYDPEILSDKQMSELCIKSAKNLFYSFKKILLKINPNVIATNTMSIPWGAITASFLRKPHVWFIHEFGESDHGLKPFLSLDITLKVIKNFSTIILTNSEVVRKELFSNVSKEKVLTVYQHINIPATALYQKESKHFSRKNSTKLIISGTVHQGKGQKYAILAVKELLQRGRDVELIIMGYCTGQYADHLKVMVKQENLKEHVKFIGFKENPYPIVNQTDIVLICSRKEAFGRVTIEAMLLKKPVIGTNSGGTPELIKEGFNGLLYEAGDYKQLADRIEYLIDNPNKTKRLGKNGYKFAKETFSKDKFGGKIYQLLLNLKQKVDQETFSSDLSLKGPALLDSLLAAAAVRNQKITTLITELGSALKIKESNMTELTSNLQEKESQIQEKESQIQEKESQIHSLEFQIQQIQQSILMQLTNRYDRIMERALPSGTRRRYYYELGLTGIRVIFNEGWRSFFRKVRYWFAYRPSLLMPFRNLHKFDASISKPKAPYNLIKDIPNPKKITLLDEVESLVFSLSLNPLVSIIVPVYNQWQYTYICLKSILGNTTGVDYEIIIANDCSTDLTSALFKKIKGLTVINNKNNLGFIKNCNNAAAFARGKYILFLNNDTYVLKDWLKTMVELIEKDSKIGIIGPNLISKNGKLQESGWIMGLDGWGQPLGRDKNPANYEYNYLKEVDCVTGACLLIRRDIFLKVGSFDKRYAPAYYDEFDLAFAVRKKGYKVMVQPKAQVVHFGQITYGVNECNRLSSKNRSKFLKKWYPVLKKRPSNDYFLLRDRSQGKRVILIIDDKVPEYNKNAGSLTTHQYAKLFQSLGFKVILLPDNLERIEPYTTEMQQRGIEVIYGKFNFDSWLKDNGRYVDIVWLSRPYVSIKYLEKFRNQTSAKILYFTHDLHYLREQRRALLEKNDAVMKEGEKLKNIEFRIFQSVDTIITPSSAEKDIISKEFPDKRVEVIPLHFWKDFPPEPKIEFETRKDIVFLGGFSHLPNVDAVLWFVKEIFSHVLNHLPGIRLFIIGGDIPKKILDLASNNVIFTDYVKLNGLRSYFERTRVFVAPLRYGAGLKGKIVISMYYGVPSVITTIANEGLEMIDGKNALIADNPREFAKKVVKLYTNKNLWERLSRNSIKLLKSRFSSQIARREILSIVGSKRSENTVVLKK